MTKDEALLQSFEFLKRIVNGDDDAWKFVNRVIENTQDALSHPQNFCSRCGKHSGLEGHIHTCTPPGEAAVEEVCGHCCGSGRMVRDPDIGTDQECFVCDGRGSLDAAPAPNIEQASKPELDQLREQNMLLLAVYDAVKNYPFQTDTLKAALEACRCDALPAADHVPDAGKMMPAEVSETISDQRILDLAAQSSAIGCRDELSGDAILRFARVVLAERKP